MLDEGIYKPQGTCMKELNHETTGRISASEKI